MSKAMRTLLWKEWLDLRVKTACVCAILGITIAIGMLRLPNEPTIVLLVALTTGAIFWPLFVSMGLVAAERQSGTLGMIFALPVRPKNLRIVAGPNRRARANSSDRTVPTNRNMRSLIVLSFHGTGCEGACSPVYRS